MFLKDGRAVNKRMEQRGSWLAGWLPAGLNSEENLVHVDTFVVVNIVPCNEIFLFLMLLFHCIYVWVGGRYTRQFVRGEIE